MRILRYFRSFYFDFNTTYVGAGMICSHQVNLSLLLGAVLSYGVLWPLISQLKGQWFPESLEESDMKSLYGYKVSLFASKSYFPSAAGNSLFLILTYNMPSFLGRLFYV